MTSTPRSDMRFASSWIVIVSGIVTSRCSFSLLLGVAMAGHALRAAAERRDRTLAHFVGGQCRDERQTAALLRGARARRLRGGGGPHRGTAHTAPRRTAIVILGFRRNDARAFRARRFFFPKALLGDLVGLALGLLVVTAALFLGTLARFGRIALRAVDRIALRADLRLFLGDLALFGLAHLRVAQRMGAAALLFLGERAQHDAGGLLRRCGRCGGRRCGCSSRHAAREHADAARRADGRRGWRLGRLCFTRPKSALAHLLDHHRLRAAVAEALTHNACLGARLERQRRLRSDAQFLAGTFRISSHSLPILNLQTQKPRAIPCLVRPDRSGSVRDCGSAQGTRCSLGLRAGQHVPHLTAPMPNPIAPT